MRAEDTGGNEDDYCLANSECDADAGLKCGFYNDYQDTGDFLIVKCVKETRCGGYIMEPHYGKQMEIRCPLSVYDDCAGQED